jgi:hypothetical protein
MNLRLIYMEAGRCQSTRLLNDARILIAQEQRAFFLSHEASLLPAESCSRGISC